jgi:hypothetical protein
MEGWGVGVRVCLSQIFSVSNEAGIPVGFALTNCLSVHSLLNSRGSTESRDRGAVRFIALFLEKTATFRGMHKEQIVFYEFRCEIHLTN